MGMRQAFGQLAGPLRALWSARIRDAVDASVAAHGVPRADLDALRGQLDALRRELTARTADVEALRQAVYAAQASVDAELDALLDDDVPAADPDRRTRLLLAAIDELSSRVSGLDARLTGVSARTEQVRQLATTARAAAESVADALDAR